MPRSYELLVPVSPRDHSWGSERAPVTLVEYGDYECPYCGAAYPVIKTIQHELGPERLRFVFRNFPLTEMHPNAEIAAEGAEAAGAQGRFWQMHDTLFEQQQLLSMDHVVSLAAGLQLDVTRFVSDLEHRRFRARVREDFMGGVRSGVSGTPGFFINGRKFEGSWSRPILLEALQEAAAEVA